VQAGREECEGLENGTGLGGYKNLKVWQRSNDLANKIYNLTGSFPKTEVYGLTNQLRRAVLSVPTNLVEGNARASKPERKHFIDIARGSLAEAEFLLGFAEQQQYISKIPDDVQALFVETARLLWAFRESL
jgi:four helix bundle protein